MVHFPINKIDQGSLAVPRSILLNANAHPKVMTAYFDYIYGAAKIIRDTIQGDALDAQLVQDVNDIIAFEVEIAKVQIPKLIFNYERNIICFFTRFHPLRKRGEIALVCTIL